jgi:hypothetical protein
VYQVIASIIDVVACVKVIEVCLVYQVIASVEYVVASIRVIEVCLMYQVIASIIDVVTSIKVVEVRFVYQVIASIIDIVTSIRIIEVSFVYQVITSVEYVVTCIQKDIPIISLINTSTTDTIDINISIISDSKDSGGLVRCYKDISISSILLYHKSCCGVVRIYHFQPFSSI